MVGDVSGDGRPDRVVVAYRPQPARSHPRCLYTLDVTTNGRRVVVPLRDDRAEFRSWDSSDRPAVRALADLSGRPGLELVVSVGASASREFFVLYALRNGELRRLKLPERDDRYPDALRYGSSTAGQTVVGCVGRAGSGEIVQTHLSYYPNAGRALLQRRFFRLDGWTLQRERLVRRSLSARAAADLDLPEFEAQGLFPNCLG